MENLTILRNSLNELQGNAASVYPLVGKINKAEIFRVAGIICITVGIVFAAIAIGFISAVLIPILLGIIAIVLSAIGIGLIIHGENIAKTVKVQVDELKKTRETASDLVEQPSGSSLTLPNSPQGRTLPEETILLIKNALTGPINKDRPIMDAVISKYGPISHTFLAQSEQEKLWEIKCSLVNNLYSLKNELYFALVHIQNKSFNSAREFLTRFYGKLEGFDAAFKDAFASFHQQQSPQEGATIP